MDPAPDKHSKLTYDIDISPILQVVEHAVPGRPFIVEGKRLRANWLSKFGEPKDCDWQFELCPVFDELTLDQREILGDRWIEMGQEEHASIASFARFIAQLLALGAPAHLVEFAIRSMQDEADHAKLCFGLAGASLGGTVMVGEIPMGDSALSASEPWKMLFDTIVEGCVGETISAAIAAESIRQCQDPVVKEILEKITRDESNHAKLAWDFVEWMLKNRPELISPTETVFDLAEQKITSPVSNDVPPSQDMLALARFGILWQETTRELTFTAFKEKVLPRARKLINVAKEGFDQTEIA